MFTNARVCVCVSLCLCLFVRTMNSDNKAVLGGGDGQSKMDVQEVIHRLGRYLTSNGCTVQVPIAEAMITYREPT